ncbi:MAG: hypothetical protein RL141_363 [Candidatus Parcubacteria bacterium]|jgi:tetratricopeptide (TPR) repeat protein
MLPSTAPSFQDLIPTKAPDTRFSRFLGKITDVCLILVVALVPLWFLPVTLDVLELNKQTLLVVLTLIALLAWVGQGILTRSFSIARSWLHLVVLFFLAGYGLTSVFSLDRYLSFVGNVGQVQWAFATMAALVLFYFLIVNRLRDRGQALDLVLWFLFGSLLTGIYGLLQVCGVFLFGGSMASVGFNTVGTANALGVFIVIPVVLAASLTVLGCRAETCALSKTGWQSWVWQGVLWATLVVGFALALVIDYWVVWAGILFGSVLIVVLPFIRHRRFHRPVMLIVPALFVVASVSCLSLWALSQNSGVPRTPLLPIVVPSEVSPSAGHTWDIARQTLRDRPLFGSGPGTWLYDYAKYRATGVNMSEFWNIRFERGRSAVLTLAAMMGVVGMALLLVLVLSVLIRSVSILVREKDDEAWQAHLTVFVGWSTMVFLAFFYNYNLAHQMAFWFLLALLGFLSTRQSWTFDRRTRPAAVTALSAAFLVLAVCAMAFLWLAGQRWMADVRYAQAVRSFQRQEPIENSISLLDRSAALNAFNDGVFRSLSQAHLVAAGGIMAASQSGEPEPSAAEEQTRQMQAHISAALAAAARATDINPVNVDNWANAAGVFEALSGVVQGSETEAIARYEQALLREPHNPAFMNGIGKLYVVQADREAPLLQSPDEAARMEAKTRMDVALAAADGWFMRSLEAKADYAPAHFNLGIVYERQGRTDDAVKKMEEALSVNPGDVGVAFQLASLYQRTGRTAQAITLFENILVQSPTYANARWLLSLAYEQAGLYDEAIAQVEAVTQANPNVAEVSARLESLRAARAAAAPAEGGEAAPLPENITSNPPESNPIQ